jgi:hypothetical protein
VQTCVNKLIEISSAAICHGSASIADSDAMGLRSDIVNMLAAKNGFYAFKAALHVFPRCNHDSHENLGHWNDFENWKSAYGELLGSATCFAQDVFGEQFATLGADIVGFNPESGAIRPLASTIEDWACRILADYETMTGYPFANDWQETFRVLRDNERLMPKRPFILGGTYDVNNLYAFDALQAMRLRGDIYRQIANVPEGSDIRVVAKR